jgi:carbon-monoxide dehydrogenase iron sulfur subunit
MANERITVHKDLCTGCRACQVACVAHHEGAFGVFLARIHVSKDEPLGLDFPETCRLCGRAPCVAACPTEALYIDSTTSAVLLRSEDCVQCSACVEACPFSMVQVHPETHLPLICDLCGGEPSCVKRCPTGAITYGEPQHQIGSHPARQFVVPTHPIPDDQRSRTDP